jgi:hypothetical protein
VKKQRNEECLVPANSMFNVSKDVPTLHFGISVTVQKPKLMEYAKRHGMVD